MQVKSGTIKYGNDHYMENLFFKKLNNDLKLKINFKNQG